MNTIQNCVKVETTENKYLYTKAKNGKENEPYQIVMITFNMMKLTALHIQKGYREP